MHLKDYPHYYVKGSERRAVYFTGEARDLRSQGWEPEKEAPVEPEKKASEPVSVEPERIKVDVVLDASEPQDLPSFEFMTKAELLSYAMDRGVDLPNNMLKAEVIAECKKLAVA